MVMWSLDCSDKLRLAVIGSITIGLELFRDKHEPLHKGFALAQAEAQHSSRSMLRGK